MNSTDKMAIVLLMCVIVLVIVTHTRPNRSQAHQAINSWKFNESADFALIHPVNRISKIQFRNE